MSFHLFKNKRRKDLIAAPAPGEWTHVLDRLPYIQLLSSEDRKELEQHLKVFLGEKSFVAAQGIELTDAMCVTIAAHACVLLLHRETDYYPKVEQIVIYPTAFVSEIQESIGSGAVISSPVARIGEASSHTGSVVLAWDHVAHDVEDLKSGRDVVFHEFAHQLDGEDGTVDGAPQLPSRERYRAWAKVLGKEYEELDAILETQRTSWIDPYADTNPAEFFAVVTEMFFKAPYRLKAHNQELYQQFTQYFQQDPITRFEKS